MRFLVDRCAGRQLAEWPKESGNDVLALSPSEPNPNDRALLKQAASEQRVLITMDQDFGELIYVHGIPHNGLIRLPDVHMSRRIALVEEIINHHGHALDEQDRTRRRGHETPTQHPGGDR